MSNTASNILGTITRVSTATGGSSTLRRFLYTLDAYGVQVQNNFEITFSTIQETLLYAQSINIPGIQLNTTDVFFDGKKVTIPVNYDYAHEFSITFINDAQGYIYPTLRNLLIKQSTNFAATTKLDVTVKSLTGDYKYRGTVYTLHGVRLTGIDELQYAIDSSEKSTFTAHFLCTHTDAAAAEFEIFTNILGLAQSIIS